MNRTHWTILGLVVAVGAIIAVLEISGLRGSTLGAATGEGGGCAASTGLDVPDPAERPADIVTGKQAIPRPAEPAAGPQDPDAELILQRYIVALSPRVVADPGRGDDGSVSVGFAPVDDALAGFELREFGALLPEIEADNERATQLGLANLVVFETDAPPAEVFAALEAIDEVDWVENDGTATAMAAPDDPLYVYQWHLTQLGMEAAWDLTDGSGVTVAVLDTGVSAGSDGYASLLPGRDFVDNDVDPSDEHGHGTHVAGTIAQATGNGVGTAGVAPGAAILPVRVLDADGSGSYSGIASGVVWATDNGADVINMSLGGASYSATLETAVDYAASAGVLVVCASGNDGYTNFISYPAAFDSTLAVGATDLNRDVSYYSNQGGELDIVGPGGDTTVDHNGDGMEDGILQETFYAAYNQPWAYYPFMGTSMATPHVAGVAALVLANASDGDVEVTDALTATAMDLGAPGRDDVYGHGLVDPVAAMGYQPTQPSDTLELVGLSERPLGPGRVLLRWFTEIGSTHTVSGDNGYTTETTEPVRRHRALLRGQPGSTVQFTVECATEDGLEGSAVVDVVLPDTGSS